MNKLRGILGFLRPFKRPLLFATALTGCLTLIGMAPPLLMRRLLNDVARQGKWGLFPLLIGLLFAIPLLRALVNIANAITLNRVSLGIIARIRKAMFAHLMRLSMRFYDEMPVGGINQRLMGDAAAVSTVATGGLIMLVTDVIAVGFAVFVMLKLSLSLSALTFSLLPLYYLNYRFFSKRIQQNTVVVRSHMDHISSTLQERLSAHELIQSYGQEKAQSTQFSSQAKQIMDAAVKGSSYNISYNHLTAFINKIGNTCIYCAGCYFFVKDSMGYGDVVAFCAYASQLLGPVVRFAAVANQLVQVGVSVERMNEVMNRKPAITESPDAQPVNGLKGDISVSGLTFNYQGQTVLNGVSLCIPAGSDLAVVGPSGGGKSTLGMLLRRFYDPTEGSIEVDGKDIRKYRLKDYRSNVALVLPESAIFDGTIRENLCYGNPDAEEQRMVAVSEALGLHEFVKDLADGYDTRLGAGGLKLSVGVQQQIGIGRALLSEPFILIADEATASLDPDSAERINQAIRSFMKKKTCILIVNRVLMAKQSDKVAVIDQGMVTEMGKHDELLRGRDTLYRSLFAKQYGQDRLPQVQED